MYVLEGSCLALSEGEPVHLNQGDGMFIGLVEWHGVRNDTDQAASTQEKPPGYAEFAELCKPLQRLNYHSYLERGNRRQTLVLQRHFALASSAASILGTLQRSLIIFATH
jgi:hypothetical protein